MVMVPVGGAPLVGAFLKVKVVGSLDASMGGRSIVHLPAASAVAGDADGLANDVEYTTLLGAAKPATVEPGFPRCRTIAS